MHHSGSHARIMARRMLPTMDLWTRRSMGSPGRATSSRRSWTSARVLPHWTVTLENLT